MWLRDCVETACQTRYQTSKMRSMAGVTHLQEFEGHAKYGATSYKGRMGERQDKQVAGDACCP